jgi:hypothetical protein
VPVRILAALCAALLLADLVYAKHGHYGFESWISFYGLFGFGSAALLILVANALRRVLGRDEDYYD